MADNRVPLEQYGGQDPRKGLQAEFSIGRGGTVGGGVVQDDTIPVFLKAFVEPYLQKKKDEAFFKGFIDQQEAGAEVEVIDSDNPINKIFGPTGYQQGASAFQAMSTVAKQEASWMQDPEIHKLAPQDLAKKMAEDARGMMTGNKWADSLIQKSMLERMGPATNAILKKRQEYLQTEAQTGFVKLGLDSGASLQATATEQMRTAPPGEVPDAVRQSEAQYAGTAMVKPYGMTDEAFKKAQVLIWNGHAQAGNFRALEVLKKGDGVRGILDIVDPADATRMLETYNRQGDKAMESQRLNPDISGLIIKAHQMSIDGQHSANEIIATYGQINAKVRAATGIDRDLFDPKEILNDAKGPVDVAVREANQTRERALSRAEDEDAKAEAAAKRIAAINTGWMTGDTASVILGGAATKQDFDAKALIDWREGNVAPLLKNFEQGFVFDEVAKSAQAVVKSTIGETYDDGMDKGYQRWQQVHKTNAGLSQALYGDEINARMMRFDMLVNGQHTSKENAFVKAFGTGYQPLNLKPEDRKAARKAINDVIPKIAGNGWFHTDVNKSGQATMAAMMEQYVAINRENTTDDIEGLVKGGYEALINSGTLAHYGVFAWQQDPKNAAPLHSLVGVPKDALGPVLFAAIDGDLKAAGFKQGGNGQNLQFLRLPDRGGKATMRVVATDDTGKGYTVSITSDELKAMNLKQAQTSMRKGWVIEKVTPKDKTDNYGLPYWRVGPRGAR